jgi:hypothetical protein
MFEYKDDVRATRKGCLGSSDGKMLKKLPNWAMCLKVHTKDLQ